ncbi:MAG TPA: DNA-formamidopyrimidine glycosylase family protein, partial [Opitutaceae bacterium]|nr:DNA-formamidopyrimidine glycosylase family protein [Opitutaceae bacterium]
MPELAEVEFYRKRWDNAACGERVVRVLTHDRKKLLRELDLPAFRRALEGARLESSEARAKQMLFRFSGDAWLGLHLGMSGELSVCPPEHAPGKHDHLVLVTRKHALVFADPRMFGSVDFHVGSEPPRWWTKIAPAILSAAFTVGAVAEFLQRRRRAPIKAVLLMQERFPGVGNWMADEILWRAAIHPARLAGSLRAAEVRALWRECRRVCRLALDTIAGRGRKLPRDLNVNIPRTWLFKHRWRRGGRDPKTGTPLRHATIGGRTTCWSPARQKPPSGRASVLQTPPQPLKRRLQDR